MNREDLTIGVRYRFGYRRILNRPTAVNEFDATVRGFDGPKVLVEMGDRATTGRSNETLWLDRIASADPLVTSAGRSQTLVVLDELIEADTATTEEWRARLAGYKEQSRG